MQFQEGFIYHIYNQGNNRQRVFFKRENYLYFLRKINVYLKPYSDIIAWCLMPNHFHIMILVNRTTIGVAGDGTIGVALSDADGNGAGNPKKRTLNDSIGIMLRSYTNAINKQENRTGKLIREKTKAECLNCPKEISPSFYTTKSGTKVNIVNPEKQYPQVCFNYIHQNPLKAGLVSKPEEWEFSLYPDYVGSRAGKLVNKTVAAKYVSW